MVVTRDVAPGELLLCCHPLAVVTGEAIYIFLGGRGDLCCNDSTCVVLCVESYVMRRGVAPGELLLCCHPLAW